ncbi:MAG: hypothetical protein GY792_02000 [Gammaproteobacteria bacterium]|nr:hypothetical protein [Gammaproteobacteria bacterium]
MDNPAHDFGPSGTNLVFGQLRDNIQNGKGGPHQIDTLPHFAFSNISLAEATGFQLIDGAHDQGRMRNPADVRFKTDMI